MVHLPAVNTPQFDWALNKTGRRPQPVPPIFQPEVPARAIVDAALASARPRSVGWRYRPGRRSSPTNSLPGLLDRYLAKAGYSGQLTGEAAPPDAPANLFAYGGRRFGAHGRFDKTAHAVSYQAMASRHRGAVALTLIGLCAVFAALASRRV